ncbi:ribonuclease BN [halophilic archaeon DL31]|jgi:membrane protein|nr:ribonuclease BN [halophilic archaeon DL31]
MALSTARETVALARDRNLTSLAAGLAYYAFVSIIPILLLVVAFASFFGEGSVATYLIETLGDSLSPAGQQRVTELLTDTAGRGSASVVGIITLVWSALKLFRGLDRAFEEIYSGGDDASLLERFRDASIVFLAVGAAVTLVVGVAVALARLQLDVPFLAPLGLVALVVVLVVAFLPVYSVLPPIDVPLRDALPGAALAAVGWVGLQIGFRIYTRYAGRYAAYGLIGSVLLFVTWLYFASIIVLLGAAVNAVRQGIVR